MLVSMGLASTGWYEVPVGTTTRDVAAHDATWFASQGVTVQPDGTFAPGQQVPTQARGWPPSAIVPPPASTVALSPPAPSSAPAGPAPYIQPPSAGPVPPATIATHPPATLTMPPNLVTWVAIGGVGLLAVILLLRR